MDRGPDLEADAGRRPTDLLSGMDGSFSAVEHRHKPIAGRRDLAAPKCDGLDTSDDSDIA